MDCYEIWVDLKPGVRDHQFVDALSAWLVALQHDGKIEGWRLLRSKLGLKPAHLGEFQILIDTRDMAQLDLAFRAASERAEPAESAHFNVNSLVQNFQAALYRDFPDAHRARGQEKF
ncbi:MAG: DUF6614 family protein [Hyphomonadaceae bacterium]